MSKALLVLPPGSNTGTLARFQMRRWMPSARLHSSSLLWSSAPAVSESSCFTSRAYTAGPFTGNRITLSSSTSSTTSDLHTFSSKTPHGVNVPEDAICMEDALRGSQQAYHAIGVVMKILIDGLERDATADALSPEEDMKRSLPPTVTKVSLPEVFTTIRELLQENFPDTHSSMPSSNASSSSSTGEEVMDASSTFSSEEDQELSRRVAELGEKDLEKGVPELKKTLEQLKKVLPISPSFAVELVHGVVSRNGFDISWPEDFIFGSSCVKAEVIPKNSSLSDKDRETISFVLCQSKALSFDELKNRTSRTPLLSQRRLEGTQVKGGSESPFPTNEELTVKAFTVRHAVVVPPQRYYPMYSWFYERLIGYRSMNERVVVAKLLAQSSNHALFRGFDFLVRLFTGKHIQLPTIPFLRTIQTIAGEILDNSVPIVYKDMRFYRNNEDGKWVLDKVETHHTTECIFVPKG